MRKIIRKKPGSTESPKTQRIRNGLFKPSAPHYNKKLFPAIIIDNLLAIFDGEIYHFRTGKLLLGLKISIPDLPNLCFAVIKQAKHQQIDIFKIENEMKLFGLLLSCSSEASNLYFKRKEAHGQPVF